ncbi:Maf family protein [Tepidimicrobium xylanilyticum]|uniref:dTTP/UTP pyrophosphatase n=1 Tax=Tepidimicrobium xylanilyticum TaxID=1123352 RepID=A0A1H3BWS1_9FIRM|nr:Maf family protein [Tepidimicrobium xylanilyticum]GMG97262.1 Maf-like protein [Tepidimicrobium xylanilyticum]SDX45669.1 septum formation protein [Tepidimicrobium xylanilyticum]
MKKVVLASASPRRKELLLKFNIEPIIIESKIEERISPNETAEQIAMALSFEKANKVAKELKNDEIVIGADTIVVFEDKILGKPKSPEEGMTMLKLLSGKKHEVITGIAIIQANSNKKIIDFEKTVVKFRNLTNEKIKNYINTGEYIDKAGGYAIQGLGGVLVEYIEGCYYNVIGLPIYKLDLLLERHFNLSLL